MALHPNLIAGWKKYNKERREDTHCKRGHEYTEENTYWYAKRNSKGGLRWTRQCRRCRYETTAARIVRILSEMRADSGHRLHGTHKGYSYGCRCMRCKVANSQYHRKRRIRMGLAVLPGYGVTTPEGGESDV